MEKCKCSKAERNLYGKRWIWQGSERVDVCNNCDKHYDAEAIAVEEATDQPNSFPLSDLQKKVPTTLLERRVSGIEDIVRRMWIWISIQAVFIGFWVGNTFGNLKYDYYGNLTKEFDFGLFILGTLIGFGTFAPLVFIVQALREIVINIVKGPLDKSEQ